MSSNDLIYQSVYFNSADALEMYRPRGASNGEQLPLKLKSSQVAAIASKQPKQGPVVLPRPHMKVQQRTFLLRLGIINKFSLRCVARVHTALVCRR